MRCIGYVGIPEAAPQDADEVITDMADLVPAIERCGSAQSRRVDPRAHANEKGATLRPMWHAATGVRRSASFDVFQGPGPIRLHRLDVVSEDDYVAMERTPLYIAVRRWWL